MKLAWRSLLRSPVASVTAFVTLAVSIAAATATGAMLDQILFRPLTFPAASSVVEVREVSERTGQAFAVSAGTFVEWRARSQTISKFAIVETRVEFREWLLTSGGPAEYLYATTVSPDFFDVLGVQPILGRTFRPEPEQGPRPDREVLISFGLWQRRYGGSREVIGQRLEVQKWLEHTIVGVMPRGFSYPDDTDLWGPLVLNTLTEGARRVRYGHVLAHLRPGVDWRQADVELRTISAHLGVERPGAHSGWTARAIPLHEAMVGSARETLWMIAAVGICVFIVAAVNIAALLGCQAQNRRRETRLKSALGASPTRLMREAGISAALLCGTAGAAGTAVASIILELIAAGFGGVIPRASELVFDSNVLAIGLMGTLVATAACTAGPIAAAGLTSTPDEIPPLNETQRVATRRMSALVVCQVALSVGAVVCAVLLVKSYTILSRINPGFEAANVVAIETRLPGRKFPEPSWPAFIAFYDSLIGVVRRVPGVEAAAGISDVPFSGRRDSLLASGDRAVAGPVEQAGSGSQMPVSFHTVTPGYFAVVRVPLLEGRDFEPSDRFSEDKLADARLPDENPVAIVTSQVQKTLFAGNALGQRIRVSRAGFAEWMTIVGVVGDVRLESLEEEPQGDVYVPLYQWPASKLDIVTRHDGSTDVARLGDVVSQFDPDMAIVSAAPLGSLVADALSIHRARAATVLVLGAIAALLACVGIYALAAQLALQRRYEVALRLALGATPRGVALLALKRAMMPVVIGLPVGCVLAGTAMTAVSSVLYGVSPVDAETLATAVIGTLGTAVLSQIGILIRVMRTVPQDVLKEVTR